MMKYYIIGTGSQARYVIEIFKKNGLNIEGLVDIETANNVGKDINGSKILCVLEDKISDRISTKDSKLIIAYGNNKKKEEIANRLLKLGYKFFNAISSDVYLSEHVEIGEGTIINPRVTIMPNTKIGNHVIIHSGSVIEHDNTINDFSNIAPGVVTAGNVKIGRGAYVYTGARVVPKITIGDYATVGAGAVVLKDVKSNSVVVGIPARVLRNE